MIEDLLNKLPSSLTDSDGKEHFLRIGKTTLSYWWVYYEQDEWHYYRETKPYKELSDAIEDMLQQIPNIAEGNEFDWSHIAGLLSFQKLFSSLLCDYCTSEVGRCFGAWLARTIPCPAFQIKPRVI